MASKASALRPPDTEDGEGDAAAQASTSTIISSSRHIHLAAKQSRASGAVTAVEPFSAVWAEARQAQWIQRATAYLRRPSVPPPHVAYWILTALRAVFKTVSVAEGTALLQTYGSDIGAATTAVLARDVVAAVGWITPVRRVIELVDVLLLRLPLSCVDVAMGARVWACVGNLTRDLLDLPLPPPLQQQHRPTCALIEDSSSADACRRVLLRALLLLVLRLQAASVLLPEREKPGQVAVAWSGIELTEGQLVQHLVDDDAALVLALTLTMDIGVDAGFHLEPLRMLVAVLAAFRFDVHILIDLLSSPETSFLTTLLRYVKHLTEEMARSRMLWMSIAPDKRAQLIRCFTTLNSTLERLWTNAAFPYKPSALIRRIALFLQAVQ